MKKERDEDHEKLLAIYNERMRFYNQMEEASRQLKYQQKLFKHKKYADESRMAVIVLLNKAIEDKR